MRFDVPFLWLKEQHNCETKFICFLISIEVNDFIKCAKFCANGIKNFVI